MKKTLALSILVAIGCLSVSSACQRHPKERPEQDQRPASLRVVATVLPVENLTLAIASGSKKLDVRGLLPATGGCPHDYSLTPGDVKKLEGADMLVAVGLGYEPFLEKIQKGSKKPMEIVLAGETVEKLLYGPHGHEGGEGEDHGDEESAGHAEHGGEGAGGEDRGAEIHREGHGHEHGAVNDHPFVSPKQGALMARAIASALIRIDPEEADLLRRNEESLVRELEAIHAELKTFVATLGNKRVAAVSPIFAYLLRDIGLEEAAVLTSRHLEALSAGRMAEVVARLKQNPPALILNEDQFDERIARSFGQAVGAEVITVGTQTSGPRGPRAYLDQARAIAAALERGLRGRP